MPPQFLGVLQLVDSVYDDMPDNLTDGALYYANMGSPGYSKAGWFDRNIVKSVEHPKLTQIGTTSYFK
jgi:hypothetical protein